MNAPEQLLCQSCGSALKPNATFCTECGGQVLLGMKKQNNGQVDLGTISERDEYRGYVQIVAVIEIAFGFFSLVLGIILIIFGLSVGPEFFQSQPSDIPPGLFQFISMMILLVGILLLIFGLLSVYFGTRLYQFQQMGRIGSLVIGALHLINIPFGTTFGIVALYLLVKPEVIALFEKQ